MAPRLRTALLLATAAGTALAAAAPTGASSELGGAVDLRQVFAFSDGDFGRDAGYLEGVLSGRYLLDLNRLDAFLNGSVSARVEEYGDLGRNYSLNGIGGVRSEVADDRLFVDGSIRASQAARGLDPLYGGTATLADDRSVQLVSLQGNATYAQPLSRELGLVVNYGGSTLLADNGRRGRTFGGGLNSAFGNSTQHGGAARLTYGGPAAKLRTGLSTTYRNRHSDILDQDLVSWSAGGNVLYYLSRKLSIGLDAGYQEINNDQQAVLRNADGEVIRDSNGRPVVDPTRRRQNAYDFGGFYGILGLRYAPSRRTDIAASAGYRDGGEDYSLAISHRPTARIFLRGNVNRSLRNFASAYGNVGFPTFPGGSGDFGDGFQPEAPGFPDVFDGNIDDCPLGFDPLLGECISDDQFLPLTNATYRGTTATASANYRQDRWSIGGLLSWSQQEYFSRDQLSDIGDGIGTSDRTADTYTAGLNFNRQFADDINFSMGATYSHSAAFFGRSDIDFVRVNAGVRAPIMGALSGTANVAAFHRSNSGLSGDRTTYLASVGVGYRF